MLDNLHNYQINPSQNREKCSKLPSKPSRPLNFQNFQICPGYQKANKMGRGGSETVAQRPSQVGTAETRIGRYLRLGSLEAQFSSTSVFFGSGRTFARWRTVSNSQLPCRTRRFNFGDAPAFRSLVWRNLKTCPCLALKNTPIERPNHRSKEVAGKRRCRNIFEFKQTPNESARIHNFNSISDTRGMNSTLCNNLAH